MSVHELRNKALGKGLSWPTDDLGLISDNMTPDFSGDFLGPALPIVEDLASANCVPVDYVAHALLAIAGSLLSGRICIRPFPTVDWRERPILWVALVGHPSTRKTAALYAVFKPLTLLQSEIDEKLAGQKTAASEPQGSDAKSDAQDGSLRKTSEASETPAKKAHPRDRRLFVQDATMEAVCDVAADNPEGLLIVRDELSGFLETRDRYHSGSAPFFIEGYQGGVFTVDRRSREEKLIIPSLSLSVLGTIQPDLVDPIFAGPKDGCAARMLFIWPEPRRFEVPTDYTDHSATLLQIYRKLNRVIFDRNALGPFGPREIVLTREAAERFASWNTDHEQQIEETGGHYGAFMGKAAGMVLRVALISEFLKASIVHKNSPNEVSLQTLDRVIDWMESYMKPMMVKVLGDAAVDRNTLNARAVLRYVSIELIGNFNKREFMRAPHKKHFPDIRSAKDMDRALSILEDHGWIRPILSDGPGRRRSDFDVNRRVRALRDELLGIKN